MSEREFKLLDAGELARALDADNKLESVIRVLIDSIGESAVTIVEYQQREAKLRTALNNLIGAIIHKGLTNGLEDDLAEARTALGLD